MKKGHWKDDSECELNKQKSDTAQQQNGQQNKDRPVHFHMVQLQNHENEHPGPLVDDKAPYSGMGIEELRDLFLSSIQAGMEH